LMVTIATELHRQHAVWRVVWGTRCGSGHVIIHLPNMMEKIVPNMVKTETVGLATRSLVQVSRWVVSVVSVQTTGFSSGSGQKTPALRKKSPAPAENFQLRQINENSKFNGNFTFQSGSTIFDFDFHTSHEHFVLYFLCMFWCYVVRWI
jgi:hypothetical protein